MFELKKVLIASATIFHLACVIIAQSTGSQVNYDKANELLNKILASRNKMKNLQFNVEASLWLSHTGRNKDGPENTFYDEYNIVMDYDGHEKRTQSQYSNDSSGKKRSKSNQSFIISWDGDVYVEYHKLGGGNVPGGATLRDSLQPILKHQSQPWRTCTGQFAGYMASAIREQKPVNIETLEDGKYRISFNRNESEITGVIDPEKGFSCISMKTNNLSKGGKANYEMDYEEFADGVWVPVAREIKNFNSAGVVTQRTNEKVSNIIVNDPNFNKTLFYVDLPKGTRVFDTVSGLRYIVGESMSEKPDGVSKNLNEVAMDTLEDMAEQNVQIEIFIPQSGIALEKDESFVLSLSDGKLINPKKMPESEESHKFLTKLGRGDIAWDDKLVAVRGAKVLTTKQQASKPLKSTKGKWSISYELPDKAELPYSILVVTKENQTYLMNITKIENNGIRITYRKLNPDEINLYKPEAANN